MTTNDVNSSILSVMDKAETAFKSPVYKEGFDAGRRFLEMEKIGWDPGNTYLALMTAMEPEWVRGFEKGLVE